MIGSAAGRKEGGGFYGYPEYLYMVSVDKTGTTSPGTASVTSDYENKKCPEEGGKNLPAVETFEAGIPSGNVSFQVMVVQLPSVRHCDSQSASFGARFAVVGPRHEQQRAREVGRDRKQRSHRKQWSHRATGATGRGAMLRCYPAAPGATRRW